MYVVNDDASFHSLHSMKSTHIYTFFWLMISRRQSISFHSHIQVNYTQLYSPVVWSFPWILLILRARVSSSSRRSPKALRWVAMLSDNVIFSDIINLLLGSHMRWCECLIDDTVAEKHHNLESHIVPLLKERSAGISCLGLIRQMHNCVFELWTPMNSYVPLTRYDFTNELLCASNEVWLHSSSRLWLRVLDSYFPYSRIMNQEDVCGTSAHKSRRVAT